MVVFGGGSNAESVLLRWEGAWGVVVEDMSRDWASRSSRRSFSFVLLLEEMGLGCLENWVLRTGGRGVFMASGVNFRAGLDGDGCAVVELAVFVP